MILLTRCTRLYDYMHDTRGDTSWFCCQLQASANANKRSTSAPWPEAMSSRPTTPPRRRTAGTP
eukprot:SAG22_NODE_7996_length_692_cov_2.478921_1_plen_63_part_01